MRPSILVAGTCLAVVSNFSAHANWSPAGPYTFTQGQTYELFFEQPATDYFLAADLAVRYSPLVYEPLSLLPGTLASYLGVFASDPMPAGAGLDEILIQVSPDISQEFDIGLSLPAGSMFGVRFRIRDDAPLGSEAGNVFGDAVVTWANPLDPLAEVTVPFTASFSTTITPVPEPGTWATMLAGLALLAGAAGARRRKAAMRFV
jgi:hypothetical protein